MSPRPQHEAEDDSARSYDLGISVLRKELEISRKALREIAEPYNIGNGYGYVIARSELHNRVLLAREALAAIQAVRGGERT